MGYCNEILFKYFSPSKFEEWTNSLESMDKNEQIMKEMAVEI
jgi:hypothetical protein